MKKAIEKSTARRQSVCVIRFTAQSASSASILTLDAGICIIPEPTSARMTPNNEIVAMPAAPMLPAPIPTPSRKSSPMTHPRNGPRELVETVVFVVVLVLLLRSFVAEAFVIPTGSMAETLARLARIRHLP